MLDTRNMQMITAERTNNQTEQLIRLFVMAKKTWLFCITKVKQIKMRSVII